MRVLFIYSDYAITNSKRFQRGVAYLSSSLKKDGVETGLIHVYNKPVMESFLKRISDFKPDIIAYSSISNQYSVVRQLSNWSKDLGIYTIYGGVHPTIKPEECLNTPGVNAICIGEGDEALPEFCAVFSKGGDITQVRNFWVKNNAKIYRSPVRPLIENLDNIPFPDYDLFPYHETDDFSGYKVISVQASRGCPNNCTYCCNHYLRSLYPNKNYYLRFRSVGNVMAELKYLRQKYPNSDFVRFCDDTLSCNKKWFQEFVREYKAYIGLPYSTNVHPHHITQEIAKLYRESGCVSVEMGIENGNEVLRKKVMNRHISNEDMINSFGLLRKENINTNAFNIFGIIGESMLTILDTVKLNAKCRPKSYIKAYFQPFFGTKAFLMCKDQNLAIRELKTSFFEEPAVDLPTVSYDQIMFGFKYFSILVAYYKLLYSLSNNKDLTLVRISDKIFTHKWFPYALLNKLMLNEMDIRKNFPRAFLCMIKIKRFLIKVKY